MMEHILEYRFPLSKYAKKEMHPFTKKKKTVSSWLFKNSFLSVFQSHPNPYGFWLCFMENYELKMPCKYIFLKHNAFLIEGFF